MTEQRLPKILLVVDGFYPTIGGTELQVELLSEAFQARGHEVQVLAPWLERHRPGRAAHVMARLSEMRGGRTNDPRFGSRMTGQGATADLLAQRFALASRRLGLARKLPALDCARFAPPPRPGDQLARF